LNVSFTGASLITFLLIYKTLSKIYQEDFLILTKDEIKRLIRSSEAKEVSRSSEISKEKTESFSKGR
jgi:hypothetical protein